MSLPDAPHSTLPYPPLHTNKKFVILSDWCVEASHGILLTVNHHIKRRCQGWYDHNV